MIATEQVLAEIAKHAEAEYPKECCGLVVVRKGRQRYMPVRNIAENANAHFIMDPTEQAAAEDEGEIVMVVHSHPNIPPTPSQADLIGCETSGVPWLIINWPTGATHTFEPTGYVPPLYGREFVHGVLDCYSFLQGYYQQELGIVLPNFDRSEQWWLKGDNLYMEGFSKTDFAIVHDTPKQHDAFFMCIGSPVPNHAAVYLGEGLIGHHETRRLSSRDVYGGWYQKITTHTLRHKRFL